MGSKDGDELEREFEVRLTADSHFAWLRTRLAIENTMLAYLRTAVSLIGFGFGVFQFVYRLRDYPSDSDVRFPDAAWYLGMLLIGTGVLATLLSIWEYRRLVQYLWSDNYRAIAGVRNMQGLRSLYSMAIVLTVVGVFAFLAVLLRMW